MNKQAIVEKIKTKLSEELGYLTKAAIAAHEAATGEESKAEDQYDTRGLEASYLAGAQSQRAAEVQKTLALYQSLEIAQFSPTDRIAATALMELESERKRAMYFLAPYGTGMTIEVDGITIQVITAQSPLGEELLGRRAGDLVEIELRNGIREYKVRSVA